MASGTCLAVLVLAAQIAAREPQAIPPPVVFPSGTELVTVDVVVVDEKGRPVEGLTPQDFEVREDGQPREITTFEEVRVPEAPAPPPSPPARPKASSNSGPPPARTFVIVFDELHLSPAAVGRAKAAVASFLRDGTRPGDRVVLVPTAAGRSWTDTMPEGQADLLALLDTMAGRLPSTSGPDHLTDWEALRIHVHRDERVFSTVLRRFYENGAIPECMPNPMDPASCEVQRSLEGSPLAKMKAAQVYDESVARRRATLRALDAVMESLVPVKGRKSVLLVSQGFILEPSLLDMYGVYDAARRANAAINFVDARGLFPTDTTVVDQGRATQVTGGSGRPSNDIGLALDQPALLSEGAEALAAETGGQSFKNSNDIGRGFDLARESTIYYLVGYAPVNIKRDGRFRRIEVKVGRPRAQVRARRGYVVPRDADLPQRAGGEKPGPPPSGGASTLPLRVAAFPLEETDKGTVRVVIAGEADASVFAWQPRDDRFEDAVDTTLNLWPRSTAAVTTDRRLVELSLPAPVREEVERTWLPIARQVELAPGVYQAELAVLERNGGRAGWVQHAFEVPVAGTFRVTAPILTDLMQPAAAAGAPPRLTPLARRSFAQGSRLYCHFDVLNAARDAQSQAKVRAGHVLRRVDGATLSRLEPSAVPPAADGRLSRMLAISLRTATPGPHELVLTVHDEVTGRTLETIEPFEVTEAVVTAEAPPPILPATAPAAATATTGILLVEPRATLERAERLARMDGAQGRRWAVAAALMMDALGRGHDASARLKALAKQAPADPDVLLALGAIEESRIDALASAPVEVPPAGSQLLPRFQRQAARDRALREAEGRYRAVLGARPDDREARLRLGRVLQRRGDREAVEHLDRVATSGSGDMKALALLFLGEWHDSAGHLKEALAAYHQAAVTAPHSQSACLALAQALLRSGDSARARETVETGLAAAGGSDPFLTYERPALRLGSSLVGSLEKEGPR